MVEVLQYALMIASIAAGIGIGVAAVIYAYAHYKVSMRSLELGLAPPPRERFSLITISLKRADDGHGLLDEKR